MIVSLQRDPRGPWVMVLAVLGVTTCDLPAPSVRLSDPSVSVTRRLTSPDGAKILIEYRQDIGGLGFTGGAALLPVNRTNGDLSGYLLPQSYDPEGWNADNSLTVKVRLIPCLQEHGQCTPRREARLGTAVNVEFDDEIGDRRAIVEDRLRSPDGTLDLVAYRYPNDGNLQPIHLSIVRAGERVPKYGNFFIGHDGGDGLMRGEWTGPRAILFHTSAAQTIYSEYGFIDNPWRIRYHVLVDSSLDHSYLWHRTGSR